MSHLLHGPNLLEIDERVAALRAELDPQGFNSSTIDIQSSTLAEVAAACQAAPFFGGGRVAVLRNPVNPRRQAAADDDAPDPASGRVPWVELSELLRAVPDANHIILRQDGALPSNHGAHKLARERGWHVQLFGIPRGNELRVFVEMRARACGAEITPRAVETLLDRLYPSLSDKPSQYDTAVPDPRLIVSELAKLAVAADGDDIDVALVESLVEDRAGYTAFALNGELFAGRAARALVELERMLAAGEPPERIFAQLASEAGAYQTLLESVGVDDASVASASGMSIKRLGGLRRNAPRLRADTIRTVTEAIRDADASVKQGLDGESRDVIVPLTARIAEAVRMARR